MTPNLSDSSARREHLASHDANLTRPETPQSATGLWLAVYTLAAALCAVVAVLIARAVDATGMQTATAGGTTFLAGLGIAITAHRFLKDH
ncbi:hypothetical protein [Actinoplanes siamensis]